MSEFWSTLKNGGIILIRLNKNTLNTRGGRFIYQVEIASSVVRIN